MHIRHAIPQDDAAIRAMTAAAFKSKAYSDRTEATLAEDLRRDGDLRLSLAAEDSGAIIGHVALSPVSGVGLQGSWFGLGPLSVRPDRQRSGVGSALIHDALAWLRKQNASGCVLVGDPNHYGRFGFVGDTDLSYGDTNRRCVQALTLSGPMPDGELHFAPAFAGG